MTSGNGKARIELDNVVTSPPLPANNPLNIPSCNATEESSTNGLSRALEFLQLQQDLGDEKLPTSSNAANKRVRPKGITSKNKKQAESKNISKNGSAYASKKGRGKTFTAVEAFSLARAWVKQSVKGPNQIELTIWQGIASICEGSLTQFQGMKSPYDASGRNLPQALSTFW